MIYIEQTYDEENGMTVCRKTVKLFGIPIYKLKVTNPMQQRDRPIGFTAYPILQQYAEEDYDE